MLNGACRLPELAVVEMAWAVATELDRWVSSGSVARPITTSASAPKPIAESERWGPGTIPVMTMSASTSAVAAIQAAKPRPRTDSPLPHSSANGSTARGESRSQRSPSVTSAPIAISSGSALISLTDAISS